MKTLLGLFASLVSVSALAQVPPSKFCFFEAEGEEVSSSFQDREQVSYDASAIYEQNPQPKLDLSVKFNDRAIQWQIFTLNKEAETENKLVYLGTDSADGIENREIALVVNKNNWKAELSHRGLVLKTQCN